jgi:beta-aspartyl-dipeptidase (metallo-type)
MLILVENGEIYRPEPMGKKSILLAGDQILKIGEIDNAAICSLGVDCELIDASGVAS